MKYCCRILNKIRQNNFVLFVIFAENKFNLLAKSRSKIRRFGYFLNNINNLAAILLSLSQTGKVTKLLNQNK